MIVIVDYGVGNLASIKNMLKKAGNEAVVSGDVDVIRGASKLILPGVGAFDYGMQQLESSGIIAVLNDRVLKDKIPVLGICLGLQLMTGGSEEGLSKGLGWLNAQCKKFKIEVGEGNLKLPHMGWTDVYVKKKSKLFDNVPTPPRFYFVHSYHLIVENQSEVLCTANYSYDFVCGVEKDNILGVQFHPEKSHKFGTEVLRNFAEKY